jgi:hypothetical protein
MRSKPHGKDRDVTAGELARMAESLTERVLAVTFPIYGEDERGQPDLLGSCVLVRLGDARFLVTAGHVFDLGTTRAIAVGAASGLLPIVGLPTRLRSIGSSSPADDRIDIGIVRVQHPAWEALETEHFASWEELDGPTPLVARHTYTLVGFPNSMNRQEIIGSRISAAGYRMAGLECERDAYDAAKIDPESHVMVGFDKKKMLGADGQRTAPDLYGASGGGLWRFGRRLRGASRPPKLAAIATEWHARGRDRYILGTRIQLIIEALAGKYEDVESFVTSHLAETNQNV